MAWKFYKADGSIITSAVAASTADTATEATNVTAVANNSTDETVYPTFVDGATGTQGIETDTGFTYNPSSGLLTITGELDAGSLDVSGNADIDGTLEADVITIDGTNVVTGSLITHLGTVAAGTWQGTVVAAAYLPDAGAAAQGVAELAVTSEINTGTDSTRIMPIDQYVASNRNIRYIFYRIVSASTDVATATTVGGDFEFPFAGTITEVGTFNDTAGITGTQVVDIHKGGTTIMGTHKCDTDTTEKTTRSGAQLPVLTVTAIAEGDILTFDIDAIHSGTAAKGLTVRIEVRVT